MFNGKRQIIDHAQARQYHFDSMRGIAACMVAVAHFLAAFYPYSVFGPNSDAKRISALESVLLYPPFSLLTAGHFAVCMFFVLSGYVLSIRIIGEKHQFSRLVGAIAKRPVRLGGVLLFSLLCAGVLFEFNGFLNQQAALVSGSNWFTMFWTIEFSWIELAKDVITFKAGSEYNPPLWTLRIELIGSFIVFGLLLLINGLSFRIRTILLCFCLFGLFNTFYAGFIWGMLLADIKKHSRFGELSIWSQYFCVAVGVLLSAFPYYAAQTTMSSSAENNSLFWNVAHQVPMFSAVFIVALVMYSPLLQASLQNRFLVWLGELSYALYAMHFLVLGSILSYFKTNITPIFGYGYTSLVNIIIYIVVLLPLSAVVTKAIDRPAMKLANRVDHAARRVSDSIQIKFTCLLKRIGKGG